VISAGRVALLKVT